MSSLNFVYTLEHKRTIKNIKHNIVFSFQTVLVENQFKEFSLKVYN